MHTRIDFDLETKAGIAKYRAFVHEAADLVVSYGGSLSGEHGNGQSRAELLPKMFGDELVQAFREFKALWDPQWKMNPGKVVNPYRVDENLRLGPNHHPWSPKTHFKFPEDKGTLARAALRCVGVGNCRREESKTMCPSYKVTREEAHSTRGRARLLFEPLQGEVVKGGWRNPDVREALDLCLACKGCKSECPVNVDMATYKAEFLSHYYKGRLRPVSAYAIGLIHWWAGIATRAPAIENFLTGSPGPSDISKALAGIAPQRIFPRFAQQSFRSWYRKNRGSGRQAIHGQAILWPNTFNNYFFPSTVQAGLDVLRHFRKGRRDCLAASGAECCIRYIDHRWRFQLPRANLPVHEPQGDAYGRGDSEGHPSKPLVRGCLVYKADVAAAASTDGKPTASQPRHHDSLVRLQPHPDSCFVGQGRTVLRADRNGFILKDSKYGLFVYETRLLSQYQLRIDDEDPIPVALSNVTQHSWLGYYVLLPPGV